MTRFFGIPQRNLRLYPDGCDWLKPEGCLCKKWARAKHCHEQCEPDEGEPVRRMSPWVLFFMLAVLFLIGTAPRHARSADLGVPADITCEQVVERVGLRPLWLAERDARRKYPDITEAQIAWGRKCVSDHRWAKIKGVFQ